MKNCCTGYWNIKIKAGEMNEKNVKFEKNWGKTGVHQKQYPYKPHNTRLLSVCPKYRLPDGFCLLAVMLVC